MMDHISLNDREVGLVNMFEDPRIMVSDPLDQLVFGMDLHFTLGHKKKGG
jgi:hypothetical protein